MRAFLFAVVVSLIAWGPATAAQTYSGTLDTKLVPSPVTWQALTPDGHTANSAPLPIIFYLHGAGGDKNGLVPVRQVVERAWKQGTMPPCVVVMLQAGKSYYMDYRDGSEKWETFYVQEFMPAMRQMLNASSAREYTAIAGTSMGGFGALKNAFKYPHLFGVVAAMAPAIESAADFDQLSPRDKFRRHLYAKHYGTPVDRAYWRANSPLYIAQTQGAALRNSSLAIYLEVGDNDMHYLHYGAEALHRALWDNQVAHQFRMVRGGDHIGPSIYPRLVDMFNFVGSIFAPDTRPTPHLDQARQKILGSEAPRLSSHRR